MKRLSFGKTKKQKGANMYEKLDKWLISLERKDKKTK